MAVIGINWNHNGSVLAIAGQQRLGVSFRPILDQVFFFNLDNLLFNLDNLLLIWTIFFFNLDDLFFFNLDNLLFNLDNLLFNLDNLL